MNRNRLIALISLISVLVIVVILGLVVLGGNRVGLPSPSSTKTSAGSQGIDNDGDGISDDDDPCPFQYAPDTGCPATTEPLAFATASPTPQPTETATGLPRTTEVASFPLTATAQVISATMLAPTMEPTFSDGGETPESPQPSQTSIVSVPVADVDELGPGEQRVYAPDTLKQGEIGVVRLEIELYPLAPTPTYKPPLRPTFTPAPNVTRPPTSTPVPLAASADLNVRRVMQARLKGVDASKFTIVDAEPMNGLRAPEYGSVSWWEWHIVPLADPPLTEAQNYSLEVIVSFTTGDIETVRGQLKFNIEVQPGEKSLSPKLPEQPQAAVPWLPILAGLGVIALIVGAVIWRQRSLPAGTNNSFLPRLTPNLPAIPFSQAICFVSYSRRDEEFVIKFTQRLHAEGVNVWRDREDIPAGASWDDEIDKALQRCTHVLFVASTSSVKSDNVGDELSAALNYQKRIVPILLEDCQLPFRIRRNQWVDFRGDFETAVAKLLKDLGKGTR